MNIKFGYCFEYDVGWDELIATVRELDRNSTFHHVWVTDALVGRDLDGPRLEAWTALAALAQATSRLRLGVMVTSNPLRHPAVLAKMATTVDHISGGRLEFAIGSGWPGQHARLGVQLHDRRERLERLDEALQVIKLLWTDPGASFEGRYYQLHEAPFSPPNVQKPHPPILVGGASEPILRIVARHANACDIGGDPDNTRRNTQLFEAYCRDAGRDPGKIRRTTEIPFFLSDDPDLQRRAMEWAVATFGNNEETVRNTSLFGSRDEVEASIRSLAQLGIQEFNLFQLPQLHLRSLMRFSDEVAPAFS